MLEKIEALENEFWTKEDEMVQDIEKVGLYVAEVNGEYVTVGDNGNDNQAVLYLGHANETMWIERIVLLDENGFEIED